MENASTSSGSSIIPTLRYRDAYAAMEWLTRAFGFHRQACFEGPGNTVAHAQMTLGPGMIMLGSVDNGGEFGKLMAHPDELDRRVTHGVYLVVPNAEPVYASARAAGAEMVMELREMEYGGKAFTCRDAEGYLWSIGEYDPWT